MFTTKGKKMENFTISLQKDDVYNELIKNAITLTFPTTVVTNNEQKLEGVVKELIATQNIRFGPAPNPESHVAIRSVVRKAIEKNFPIPILIPWGSKKADNKISVDIAEIMALKMLSCLNQRISQIYPAGININIRVEDLSGYYIFSDEGDAAITSSQMYVNDFVKLINILGLTTFIIPVKETILCSKDNFNIKSDEFTELILAYLITSDKIGVENSIATFAALEKVGWRGLIPIEQRQYYYNRYQKLYGCDQNAARIKLAKYLASCLARRQLLMRGDDPEWHNEFLEITFCPPIPGVPDSLISKRLYYRTIHAKYTREIGRAHV